MEEIDEGKITGAIDAIPLEKIEKINKTNENLYLQSIWRRNRNWILL